MAELNLAHEQRLVLRAQAHRLHPIVRLGSAGLSSAALQEIDRALRSHALIKVRATGTQRADREVLSRAIAEQLNAAQVQVIGNIVVLYRPIPEAPKTAASASTRPARSLARSSKKPLSIEHKQSLPRPAAHRRSPQR